MIEEARVELGQGHFRNQADAIKYKKGTYPQHVDRDDVSVFQQHILQITMWSFSWIKNIKMTKTAA